MSAHTARQGIRNYLTGQALCHTPRPAVEADALLDAYRAEVLAEAADALVAACPDGDAEEAFMDCQCVAADELRRMADTEQVTAVSTPRTPWAPPLDIALDIARHTLTKAEHLDLDLTAPASLAEHIGALTYALGQVLDALTTERETTR